MKPLAATVASSIRVVRSVFLYYLDRIWMLHFVSCRGTWYTVDECRVILLLHLLPAAATELSKDDTGEIALRFSTRMRCVAAFQIPCQNPHQLQIMLTFCIKYNVQITIPHSKRISLIFCNLIKDADINIMTSHGCSMNNKIHDRAHTITQKDTKKTDNTN